MFVNSPQPEVNLPGGLTRKRIVQAPKRVLRSWLKAIALLLIAVEASTPFKWLLRGFDDVWYGTTLTNVAPYLVRPRTRLHKLHSLDFDQLMHLKMVSGCDLGIVFLDSMGPAHPEYGVVVGVAEQSLADYARLVQEGLAVLERRTGESCVIALHPRARSGEYVDVYGGRPGIYGQTAHLISRSRIVACAEGSTALGMAVALKKPIAIFTSDTFPAYIRAMNERLIELLDPFVLNLDTQVIEMDELSVNSEKYKIYEARYVRDVGTPQVPFWEYVSSHVLDQGDIRLDALYGIE